MKSGQSTICISLAEQTADECVAALAGVDFAEIRLDSMQVSLAEVGRIFSHYELPLIATCRPGLLADARRGELLMAAIAAGARYVDVELEMPAALREAVVAAARAADCRVIVSFHDFETTPPLERLRAIRQQCVDLDADIAKIATQVGGARDCARLLAVLAEPDPPVVVIGMGPRGRLVRILAPVLGSPFTFARREGGRETAPGQLDAATLAAHLRLVRQWLEG